MVTDAPVRLVPVMVMLVPAVADVGATPLIVGGDACTEAQFVGTTRLSPPLAKVTEAVAQAVPLTVTVCAWSVVAKAVRPSNAAVRNLWLVDIFMKILKGASR